MGQVLRLDRQTEMPPKISAHEVRAAILEHVPATLTELAEATGRLSSDRTLRRRLVDLVGDGLLIRNGRVYELVAVEQPVEHVEVPDGFGDYRFPAHFDHEAEQLLVVKLEEYEFIEWTSSAIELLESYIGCLQRARLAHASVAKFGGDFITGKAGRVYVHPGVNVIQTAERDAQKYREALTKLDQKGGGASADDPESLF